MWVNSAKSTCVSPHASMRRTAFGRQSRRRDARFQIGGGGGKKKTCAHPRLGGMRRDRANVCPLAHSILPVPGCSRRMALTAVMRCPIHRTIGTASMPEHTDRYLMRRPVAAAHFCSGRGHRAQRVYAPSKYCGHRGRYRHSAPARGRRRDLSAAAECVRRIPASGG
jgi:hypothetical protein